MNTNNEHQADDAVHWRQLAPPKPAQLNNIANKNNDKQGNSENNGQNSHGIGWRFSYLLRNEPPATVQSTSANKSATAPHQAKSCCCKKFLIGCLSVLVVAIGLAVGSAAYCLLSGAMDIKTLFRQKLTTPLPEQGNRHEEQKTGKNFLTHLDPPIESFEVPKNRLAQLLDPHWSREKSNNYLEIFADGRTAVSRRYEHGMFSEMYTERPYDASPESSANSNVLFYFEVTILAMIESIDVEIGFRPWPNNSLVYILFDSTGGMKRKSGDWEAYGNGFDIGDVVGCALIVHSKDAAGIDDRRPEAFLTKNGVADKNVTLDGIFDGIPFVWPFAGLANEQSMLRANFGEDPNEPFKYNVLEHWSSKWR